MEYNYDMNKICRLCLELDETTMLTSIFNTDFAMMPAAMMMLCAKIKVYTNDGLPSGICNNCIYRLGAAYHFKKQCEDSDHRLRVYLGLLDKGYGVRDNETNTDISGPIDPSKLIDIDNDMEEKPKQKKGKSRSRYKKKLPEEMKKRGPKPQDKIPQTCYQCNKTFKCAAQLAIHARTHTGEKPYSCPYNTCTRRFAQKHNLEVHMRIHSGEKPLQCEVCSKQFAALGNFQAHKKIHTGIRDQICPMCNKGFITSGDLARHMVTHTGIKNHHCDICGKSFTRNRDMVAHKKKIHLSHERTTESYKCRECHKVFATAISLASHYRMHVTPQAPIAPIATAPMAPIGPALGGPSSLGVGMGIGLGPPTGLSMSMLGHPHQVSMMHGHTQRLHPF